MVVVLHVRAVMERPLEVDRVEDLELPRDEGGVFFLDRLGVGLRERADFIFFLGGVSTSLRTGPVGACLSSSESSGM